MLMLSVTIKSVMLNGNCSNLINVIYSYKHHLHNSQICWKLMRFIMKFLCLANLQIIYDKMVSLRGMYTRDYA